MIHGAPAVLRGNLNTLRVAHTGRECSRMDCRLYARIVCKTVDHSGKFCRYNGGESAFFCRRRVTVRSRGRSVGIAATQRGSSPDRGRRYVLFSKTCKPSLGPIHLPFQYVLVLWW
jgi:hypothetical protein